VADVFVSYKREDSARVRNLVLALRAAGLHTWWDEDIPPSAPWEATIEKALADAKAVIVCWSPDAVDSDNVRSEARVAREDGRLIQVFLKPCSPPLFFGERQGVDLSNWRGKADDPRITKIAQSARDLAAGKKPKIGEVRRNPQWLSAQAKAALAALLLLAGGIAGWWFLRVPKPEGPITVAVLPFRALASSDANLVDAIWDDTRGAISRNPNLRVLGRQAVETLARKGLQPADYRKKVGADYLLDGSVQHIGDQVRMKFSLTETKSGAEVWADEIGGKLDDVFTFQQQVAREVEGRVRGRIAPGGGVTAKNITTSGEVYAMYADAQALLRKEDDPESIHAAFEILKKAVAKDPNYAPAWASLGQASFSVLGLSPGASLAQYRDEPVGYIKRALQLAPNLAHAHAALSMVQGFPPRLDGELRRAVQLDPNDAEAWTWLANSLENQNRLREALAPCYRAVQIEPLLPSAVQNKIATLALLKNWNEVDAEVARVKMTGDQVLTARAEALAASMTNRPGDGIRILLQLRAAHPEEASWIDLEIAGQLPQLGFIDEGLVAARPAHSLMLNENDYRGTASSAQAIKRIFPKPADIWSSGWATMALWGREMPKQGRLKEYLGYYDAVFKSPEGLFSLWGPWPYLLIMTAPNLATALRMAGRNEEADKILKRAEALMAPQLQNGPATDDQLLTLSYLRGAQGRDDDAIALLRRAVFHLPDGVYHPSDIANEPSFAKLVHRRDFQQIRQQILSRIQVERRKVPIELLQRTYPVGTTKIAA
jgi:TolB-like protein